MKTIIALLLIIVIPVGIMIAVNEYSPPPTHSFKTEVCTRYCHDRECSHFTARNKDLATPPSLQRLYAGNIAWLQSRPFGLGYREANLLLYIITLPIFLILGFWGIIRKRNG